MYCHCTVNVFTASMNYSTDNERCDHKQATKKKPYTNNRYSFQDKHVEVACESMESFINTCQNKKRCIMGYMKFPPLDGK